MNVSPIAHRVRFDSEGRVHAEHWLTLARAHMAPEVRLDAEFLDRLIYNYFKIVRQVNLSLYRPTFRDGDVWVRTPLGNNVLVFQHQRIEINDQMVEVRWSITGGFMLARGLPDGGRFIIGARWLEAGAQLELYSKLDGYMTRLIDLFGQRFGEPIYRLTQGVSHQFIITRFLRAEARALRETDRAA